VSALLSFKTFTAVAELFSFAIIHRDTDSVFLRCPGQDVAGAIELAHKVFFFSLFLSCAHLCIICFGPHTQAADKVSARLPGTITLEFEKVYWPFLLQQNKKYAGVAYTKATDDPTKGLEIKGRGLV
jgi:DNA polymerase elongation subunit (family B)